MTHQVISCFEPPEREAFTDLLKEYYALMISRIEADGGDVGDGSQAIEEFWGKRPRSWESPGLTETDETLDLIRKHGVEYVADWVIDDLPQSIETPFGNITTIPYTVETNDITVYALQGHESDVFLKRGKDQFDRLYAEGAENARVMAISIHPYITGAPHRIRYLEELFDYVGGHDGVAWMTASEIGDWYTGQMGDS